MTIAIEIGKFTVAMATLYVKYIFGHYCVTNDNHKIEKYYNDYWLFLWFQHMMSQKVVLLFHWSKRAMKKITSYLDQTNVISAKISHLYLNIEELRAWKKRVNFLLLSPLHFLLWLFLNCKCSRNPSERVKSRRDLQAQLRSYITIFITNLSECHPFFLSSPVVLDL